MPRVSMADVAAHAGVSAQTVSRVVNGSPRVDPQTRARVEEAMTALGYRIHRAAQALRTGRTRTIGLVVSTLATVGNSRMLQAVCAAAEARDYAIVVVTATADSGIRPAFSRLHDRAVDGAIVLNEATRLVQMAGTTGDMPLVVVDAEPAAHLVTVQTDHADGARAATAHLLAGGAETVHHLAGPTDSFAAAERERGWRAALADAGAAVIEPVRGDWGSRSGAAAATALVDATAVFAANDQMALGLLHGFADLGRRVPDEVAVVGFDDVPEAVDYLPPLTTVRQDFDALAARAVARLIDLAEGTGARDAASDSLAEVLAAELVVRDSSRAARAV